MDRMFLKKISEFRPKAIPVLSARRKVVLLTRTVNRSIAVIALGWFR